MPLSFCWFLFSGNSEDVLVPTLVSGLKGHRVVDVACGSGDAQTLAVTKDGKFLLRRQICCKKGLE